MEATYLLTPAFHLEPFISLSSILHTRARTYVYTYIKHIRTYTNARVYFLSPLLEHSSVF